jgi:hypothetical protein
MLGDAHVLGPCRPRRSAPTVTCIGRLHEIAHAMTSMADGQSDGHGPIFMGVYLQLLVRYLRADEAELLQSLAGRGISLIRDARAVFLVYGEERASGAGQADPMVSVIVRTSPDRESVRPGDFLDRGRRSIKQRETPSSGRPCRALRVGANSRPLAGAPLNLSLAVTRLTGRDQRTARPENSGSSPIRAPRRRCPTMPPAAR